MSNVLGTLVHALCLSLHASFIICLLWEIIHDSSVFNPYNTSESLLFYTLDTSSGFWMTNIIHSPMKLSCFSCFTSVFMYVMTLITFCMFSNLVLSSFTLKSLDPNSLNVTYVNQKLSLMCLTHIKIGYFCLLSSIILKNISVVHATRKYHPLKLGSSKLARILSHLLLFLLIINFLFIGIVNPGMLNPGPSSLKICYQNVQGLIPINQRSNT